jgi:orotidine-5'-phosphate decarboxylase
MEIPQGEMMSQSPPLLCVALDAMEAEEAIELSLRLGKSVDMLKVGLGLFNRSGLEVVESLVRTGASLFLDLKLHDIPSQVGDAVGAITRLGVDYVTLHTAGGAEMLAAAVAQRDRVSAKYKAGFPRLLGVTVLTSLGPENLHQTGVSVDVQHVLSQRVRLAHQTGLDGIVCSPADLDFLGDIPEAADLIKVTPGIRPENHSKDDQIRTATPGKAVAAGANILVVGRPITLAPDPRAAAEAIRASMLPTVIES